MSTFAPDWAWEMLDIGAQTDQRSIKRAYSRLLKLNRPEDDPAAFQVLHQAYQAALAYAAEAEREQEQQRTGDDAAVGPAPQHPAPSPVSLDKTAPVLQTIDIDDPHAQAQQLWQRFLSLPQDAIDERMALLETDAALEGFATRDAVELLALHMAADPGCEPRLRARLAGHFGWRDGMGQLARHDPALCAMAAAQLRADSGLEELWAQQADDEVLAYLLAPDVADGKGRTRDRGFHRAMRARIDSLRWQYPDVIEHRLVPGVFAWWENYVATKKYFEQTALWSVAIGVLLFFFAQWPLALSTGGLVALFFACVGVTTGVIAWLTICPPQALLAAYAAFRYAHLEPILYQRRYEARWQHGWLAGLIALSPLLALDQPGDALRWLVSAGLTACAAVSVFAASAAIPPARIYVSLLIAAVAGFIMQHSGFAHFGYACYPFAICLSLLAAQSGEPLYDALGLSKRRRFNMRVGWLASLLLLYLGAAMQALPSTAIAMAAILLLVAGAVMARAKFHAWITWPAIVGIKLATASGSSGSFLSTMSAQVSCLVTLIGIFAVFMFVNMLTDETD